MRITYRNKSNFKYWESRWTNVNVDEAMTNSSYYPLKFSNLVVKNKDKLILEAGCGNGRVVRYYHNKKYKIIGIDFIKETIEKIKSANPMIDVRVGNICKLNFKDEYFDVILAFGLYHNFNLDNISVALNETYRVLKKGGKICVSFRSDNIQQLIIDYMNKDKSLKNKQFHKMNLKKNEFKELLESHGFKIKNIYSVQNFPFLYKFKLFRSKSHKIFDENKGRIEGYRLSAFGTIIQNSIIKLFPESFCNLYLAIASKN
jgi:ubiquinone/menaquinone biosynthesis C-methylase UbiE